MIYYCVCSGVAVRHLQTEFVIVRIFLFHVKIRNFGTYPFLVLVLMLVSFYCVNAKLLYIFIVTCLSTCSPLTGLALSVREAVMIQQFVKLL